MSGVGSPPGDPGTHWCGDTGSRERDGKRGEVRMGKEWGREERKKREQRGRVRVGKDGRRGKGRWWNRSGKRKYVGGRRRGERETLVHDISLDVCMFQHRKSHDGGQVDNPVKKQAASDSRAVFLPLWDLFHGQKPPRCHIDG